MTQVEFFSFRPSKTMEISSVCKKDIIQVRVNTLYQIFFYFQNINNVVPRFWINPNGEHPENLVVAPPPSGANLLKKQHIAFHLVSNLLDEELPEEKDRDINAGFPNSPRMNM